MKKILFIIISYIFFINYSVAQKTDHYIIVTYNVENLFDTIKTPGKKDAAFIPGGKKKWNAQAYDNKLKNIAKVIGSIDSCGCPAVVGLVEVENKKVVEDLIATEPINKCMYNIVHFESGDPRGIDNALLYSSDFLNVIIQKPFPVVYGDSQSEAMRDILYVKGVSGTDTLHFFVNHWKSRMGGIPETEPKRLNDANCLKNKTDSLFKENKNTKIIIMGDFNDNPTDKSIVENLGAYISLQEMSPYLFSPCYALYKKGIGSYDYKGEWFMFDQIIVSGGMIDAISGLECNPADTYVYNPDWLYYTDSKGKKKLSMSFSDHFPVYIILERKK